MTCHYGKCSVVVYRVQVRYCLIWYHQPYNNQKSKLVRTRRTGEREREMGQCLSCLDEEKKQQKKEEERLAAAEVRAKAAEAAERRSFSFLPTFFNSIRFDSIQSLFNLIAPYT